MKRRLPPLNAIRAFESAARLLSISEAADELSVTPTAVSHQIRHLEGLLEVKLFERAGRHIQLTDQGRRILPELTLGMDHLAAAFADIYGSTDRDTINISTTREFARYWLQPRIGDFYTRYPHLIVNIFTSEQCAELDSGETDLAVRYGPEPETDEEIYLFQEHYVAAVNKSLITANHGASGINDLSAKRLIDVRWETSGLDAPTWKKWFAANAVDNYAAFQRMSFDAYNLAFDALKRSYGAALLSRTIVSSEEFSEQLICLEGEQLPGYHYRVIQSSSGTRKPAVQAFIRWLQAQLSAAE